MRVYQVRYNRVSRVYDVWMWDNAPKKNERCVATAFRREADAYHWINTNAGKSDKVFATLH